MGIFSNVTRGYDFSDRSDAELDQDVEKWGGIARTSAGKGYDASAEYAREARATAQKERRRRNS